MWKEERLTQMAGDLSREYHGKCKCQTKQRKMDRDWDAKWNCFPYSSPSPLTTLTALLVMVVQSLVPSKRQRPTEGAAKAPRSRRLRDARLYRPGRQCSVPEFRASRPCQSQGRSRRVPRRSSAPVPTCDAQNGKAGKACVDVELRRANMPCHSVNHFTWITSQPGGPFFDVSSSSGRQCSGGPTRRGRRDGTLPMHPFIHSGVEYEGGEPC